MTTLAKPKDEQAAGPLYDDEERDHLQYLKWGRIAVHVAALIRTGQLGPGAKLPNRRAMAEEHGVAVETVTRAFRDLQERGAVFTVSGKGTFVTRPPRLRSEPRPG